MQRLLLCRVRNELETTFLGVSDPLFSRLKPIGHVAVNSIVNGTQGGLQWAP